MGWEIELVECLTGEDARAVDRIAYDLMFFEECDTQPALRQLKTCKQPGGTSTNDDGIIQSG